MVMKETGNKIPFLDQVKKAREIDLKKRFGFDVKIYEPENVTEARLQDLAIKIRSYEEQFPCNTDPIKKQLLEERVGELKDQIAPEV